MQHLETPGNWWGSSTYIRLKTPYFAFSPLLCPSQHFRQNPNWHPHKNRCTALYDLCIYVLHKFSPKSCSVSSATSQLKTLRRNQQAAGGLINSRHGSVLAAYPQSDPCGCSSSSAGTAALSSCLSCSGSRTAASPAAPPAPPGTPWRPAWRCAPYPHRRGTGAWSGNVSCTGRSGCTAQRLGRSPEVPSTRAGPAPNHTHTHLEGEREDKGK